MCGATATREAQGVANAEVNGARLDAVGHHGQGAQGPGRPSHRSGIGTLGKENVSGFRGVERVAVTDVTRPVIGQSNGATVVVRCRAAPWRKGARSPRGPGVDTTRVTAPDGPTSV